MKKWNIQRFFGNLAAHVPWESCLDTFYLDTGDDFSLRPDFGPDYYQMLGEFENFGVS